MFTNLMMQFPGKVTMQLKTEKPERQQKPLNTMQGVQRLMAQTDDDFTPDVAQSMCRQDNPSQTNKPQVTRKTFSGSLDDLDIPYIDEDEDQSWTQPKL